MTAEKQWDAWVRYINRAVPPPSLEKMLSEMNLPEMRRDTTKAANVRWLLRNIRINNNGHEHIDYAVELLKILARRQQKGAQ